MTSEFVPRSNPAGRLFYLLEAAKRVTANTMLEGWRASLEIPGALESLVLSKVGEILDLIYLTEKELSETLGDNSERLMTPVSRVKDCLIASSLSSGWTALTNLITDEALMTVALAAEKLANAGRSEIEIETQELESIQDDLEELLRTVRTSEIDPEFKELLIDELEIIRQSLVSYRISGPTALTRAFDQVAGARLRTNKEFIDQSNRDVVDKFDKLLIRLARIASVCSKAKKLTLISLGLLGLEIKPELEPCALEDQTSGQD